MNLIWYLLDKSGKRLSITNVQDGFTSLHWACREGHVQTAEFLISRGADNYNISIKIPR